jgi:hypothetical protein
MQTMWHQSTPAAILELGLLDAVAGMELCRRRCREGAGCSHLGLRLLAQSVAPLQRTLGTGTAGASSSLGVT